MRTILEDGLHIDVSGDVGLRPILLDYIDHRDFDVLVTRTVRPDAPRFHVPGDFI